MTDTSPRSSLNPNSTNKFRLGTTDRITCFVAVSNRLYGDGVGSHVISNLAKGVGIQISTKTIIKKARSAGLSVSSRWARRIGRARYVSWGKAGWKTITSNHLPVRIAQAFCAWYSYYLATGNFDVGAIAKGEKPP